MQVLTLTAPYVRNVSYAQLMNDDSPFPRPEREVLADLESQVLSWMIREELIISMPAEDHTQPPILFNGWRRNTSSMAYKLTVINFSSLFLSDTYVIDCDKWLSTFNVDNTSDHMSRLRDFVSILVSMYGVDTISYLMNITWNGYGYLIETPEKKDEVFSTIHAKYPFFWLIMYMHSLITIYARPMSDSNTP